MNRYILAMALLPSVTIVAGNAPLPYCKETVYDIDVDYVTKLGFSGRNLLDLASGAKNLDWTWDYKDGSTRLTIAIFSVAEIGRYIESVAVYPDGAPELDITCPDRVEVDAWITFATEDGAFNERWYTTIFATDGTDCMEELGEECFEPGTQAEFFNSFDRDQLNGHFYKEVDVPQGIALEFWAEAKFRQDKSSIAVNGQAFTCTDREVCYNYYIHGGFTP